MLHLHPSSSLSLSSIIDKPRFTPLVLPGISESNTSHLDLERGDFFRVFTAIFLVLSSDDELTTINLVFSNFYFLND